MALTLVTPPSIEPISTADAKAHLRVDSSADDALIDGLVAAARLICENICQRSFIETTWLLTLDHFPPTCYGDSTRSLERQYSGRNGVIVFPWAQPTAVDSVKYIDINGVQQTVPTSDYIFDGRSLKGRLTPAYAKTWAPTRSIINAVEIQFKAGFGTSASDVPQSVTAAIKLVLGVLYANREAIVSGSSKPEELPRPRVVDWILYPYKVVQS
jgi:uncharacterized phiE125 gp8 family phage protein